MLEKPGEGAGPAGMASEALRGASSTAHNRLSDRLLLLAAPLHNVLHDGGCNLATLHGAGAEGLAGADTPAFANADGGRRGRSCMFN